MSERVLPQNLDAETAILGAILLDDSTIVRIAEALQPAHFSRTAHRLIYTAMLDLWKAGTAIDHVTLAEALHAKGQLDKIGGVTKLGALTEGVPRGQNVDHYAEIIRGHALRRSAIEGAETIAEVAYQSSPQEVMAETERVVSQLRAGAAGRGGPRAGSELVVEAADLLATQYREKKLVTGISTGFAEIDEMTTGMHGGEFIVWAGRSGSGKSSMATCIADNASVDRIVGIWSLEMTAPQVAIRMVSSKARVDLKRLRAGYLSPEEIGRISGAITQLSRQHWWVDDASSLTVMDIHARAERMKEKHGLDLVIVDYIQLVATPGAESKTVGVGSVASGLKHMAKALNVPVIGLAQMSRAWDQRGTDSMPKLSDLGWSDQIGNDADAVFFVIRREQYDPTAEIGLAEIYLAKQRNGPTGVIKMAFQKEFSRFSPLEWSPPDDNRWAAR